MVVGFWLKRVLIKAHYFEFQRFFIWWPMIKYEFMIIGGKIYIFFSRDHFLLVCRLWISLCFKKILNYTFFHINFIFKASAKDK